MDIFDLSAKLTLDSSEFTDGLEGASKNASSFSDIVGGALKTALDVGVMAFTAYATAIAGVTSAMASAIADTASYGDSIDKNSQKVGMSTKSYQEWDYVMQLAGTSMQDCTVGMKTLTNQIDNAKGGSADAVAMFESLGISLDDLNSMSREDVFSSVIAGLQGMEDSTERAALANDLFGKSGQNLTPLFNMSAQETQELIDRFNELGGVMSDDAIKASARYQDSLTTLQATMDGAKRNMASEFLPSMADIMDGLTDIFSGDSSGIAKIEQGVQGIVEKVQEMLPQITEIITRLAPVIGDAIAMALPAIIQSSSQIVLAIGQGILANFPTILQTASSVLTQLGQGFIDNLPMIIEVGMQLLMGLVDGLVEALPELIDATITLIETLIDKLTEPDTMNKLIEASVKIIGALIDGFGKALPALLEGGVQLIVALAGALIMNLPKIAEVAVKLMDTLTGGLASKMIEMRKKGEEALLKMVEGLKNKISNLKTQITTIVNNALTWFKEIPTKIKDVGKNIIEGLWNGINDKVEWIKQKILGFSDSVLSTIKGFFGIHSPSTVFAKIGGYMAEGLGIGWDDEYQDVKRDIENSLGMDLSSSIKAKPIEITRQDSEIIALLQQYLPQMANKNIVMDTGALVGQIAPAMDNALGKIVNREVRFV